MREYWQTTFNVDPTQPNIGAVDVNEVRSLYISFIFLKHGSQQARKEGKSGSCQRVLFLLWQLKKNQRI